MAPAFAAGQKIEAKSAGIGYEYTTLNVDGADWAMNGVVVRGNYDFYKFDGGTTVTLTGAAYYGVGKIEWEEGTMLLDTKLNDYVDAEDTDATRYGVKIGVMFNYQATDKLTIYAGPTVGYNVFSYDTDVADIDDDASFSYGVTVGARYMLSNQKTSIDFGLSLENFGLPETGGEDASYQLWDDDRVGATSFFIGINHAF